MDQGNTTLPPNNTYIEDDPCVEAADGEYDLPLHVGAVFLLFFFSLIGVLLPIIARQRKWKKIAHAITVGKFFGAGVITATGFVHVFPSSVSSLTDPCLPSFFQEYSASAGLFAMCALLLAHLIQFLAETNLTVDDEHEMEDEKKHDGGGHAHGVLLEAKKRTISTYILEFAIAIHSIIIGADLGISTSEFKTLLIALVFHQFFEGIGLGYRLAEIKYRHYALAFINSLIYASTTPLGVAIGIGVSLSDNHAGTKSLIVTGVLDSAAAGILIYSSLLLINEEFGRNDFRAASTSSQVISFVSLYLGAGLMAVIGLWA